MPEQTPVLEYKCPCCDAGLVFMHVCLDTKDGKRYLYDLVNIKKETSNLFQS